MVTKKLNVGILTISQILHFVTILCFAVLLAKFIWWIINPSYNEAYVEKTRVNQKDSSVKFIINRYPFGMVVAPKAAAAPAIATQVNLNGVYLDGDNSMAFISYNGKAMVLKAGDAVTSGAELSKISLDSITVTQNNQDAIIKMSNGTTKANTNNGNSFSAPSVPLQQTYLRGEPGASSQDQSNTQNSQAGSDLREERRKLIERFAKQDSNVTTDTNDGVKRDNNN